MNDDDNFDDKTQEKIEYYMKKAGMEDNIEDNADEDDEKSSIYYDLINKIRLKDFKDKIMKKDNTNTNLSNSSLPSNTHTKNSIDAVYNGYISSKYDEIKQHFVEELEKNKRNPSDYTIVSSIKKVYYDLILSYKGSIDEIINEALNGTLINEDDEKPYIIDKEDVVNTEQALHSHMINTALYGSHSHSSSLWNSIPSNYTHQYFTSNPYATTRQLYNDDGTINITEFKFIDNDMITKYIIHNELWRYATIETQQRIILEKIPEKYVTYKDIHTIEFCTKFIQEYPNQQYLAETHPEIIQTKEFQKQFKLLKLKDEYKPFN